jgi:hypothetical protein
MLKQTERGIEIIDGIFNIYILEAFFIVYFVCVGHLQSLSSTGNFFYFFGVNIPFKYAKFGPLCFYLFFHFFLWCLNKDDQFAKTCIKIG